jgi:chromatin assembly factor 1 subunit A
LQRQAEQRDEEKRKREEAQKKKDEEEEVRKKRAAEKFSKFFVVPKKKPEVVVFDDDMSKDSAESAESGKVVRSNFMPFQIREGMKMAPLVRLLISKEQKDELEECLKSTKPLKNLYLNQLRKGSHKPKSSEKTWPKNDDDDVVAIGEISH